MDFSSLKKARQSRLASASYIHAPPSDSGAISLNSGQAPNSPFANQLPPNLEIRVTTARGRGLFLRSSKNGLSGIKAGVFLFLVGKIPFTP